jgi:hypothetical protein
VEMGRMEVRGLPMQKHQTLSEKQMKSKKDWGHGSGGRVVACLTHSRPWVQTPIPSEKKNAFRWG